jgi:HAD superfamily hydrolase (TIGR01509 family)
MLIKLLIFDLDGVLVDTRKVHYTALNKALLNIDEKYVISENDHIARFDGLPTTKKLEMLTNERGLDIGFYSQVWSDKQKYTTECIKECIKFDTRLIDILKKLKDDGYILYCASNSIWNTVKTTLMCNGTLEFFDFFISNEEIRSPKPSPDIYFKCLERSKLSVSEVLIFEDSPIGRKAAYACGAHVCPIKNSCDLTLQKIELAIKKSNLINNSMLASRDLRWKRDINIVIPMAGRGSRFLTENYTVPKPLIDIRGKPMIQHVVENLNIDGNYIFIIQKEHEKLYGVTKILKTIVPECKVIQTDGVTEGAACTVLLAREYIDNDIPLLLSNSDQYLEWDSNEFLYTAEADGVDGCISTFHSDSTKWSYIKLDDRGNFVNEVREKEVISNDATTGIYYWKRGSDFVKYADEMISSNIRVNNEFYLCPVYNNAISDNKKITAKRCTKMWGLGVPEDLEYFLKNHT